MVSNTPKVSFIPKNPLTHEESFMDRRRPRSIAGFLATFAFVVSVSAYGGLYFYNASLTKELKNKTEGVNKTKIALAQSPEIEQAKTFRERTVLVKELLNAHVAVSPIFDIIANNTLGSIEYSEFSFKHNNTKWQLELSGEAPSYASLAYQADVFKGNAADFNDFKISDIKLTETGSVTFRLKVSFSLEQVSYVKQIEKNSSFIEVIDEPELPTISDVSTDSVTIPTPQSTSTVPSVSTVPDEIATGTPDGSFTPSFKESKALPPSPAPTPATLPWWSWFKFW